MQVALGGAFTDGVAAQAGVKAVVLVISEDRRVRQALVSYLSAGGLSPALVTGTVYADVERVTGEIVVVVCDLDGCDIDLAFAAVRVLSRGCGHVIAVSASDRLRRRALGAGAMASADKWTGTDEIAALVRSALPNPPEE